MIRRTIQEAIEQSLFKGKAIIIYGARQVGKTTLIMAIQNAAAVPSIFLNCDEPDVRRALSDKTSTELKMMIGNNKLVLIDEAQRVGTIGLTIKLLTDTAPDIQVIATLRNELKKSRKIYFVDTGIRNAVINNLNPPELRNDVGGLWENFVIAERMKRNHNQQLFPNTYFWRSHQKQEIDYLEELNGELKGYEIKWREKRMKVPAGFSAAYPDCPVSLINRENMTEFATG
ncbi:MAG: ATP-binding protein [Deltaproteobacteria bacterium]|jgi:predicted AAA+ superfamily ATPase